MFKALTDKLLSSSPATKPAGKRQRKPANIIYGTDDRPPVASTIVLGIQHAVESASKVAVPIALLASMGVGGEQLETLISSTLLASGLSTILVSTRLRFVGFGHLLPSAFFSSFAAPAILATRAGGLPLLCGMTVVTAVTVSLLSRLLPRWRALFPPEVVGLIAFMVGASQASLAVTRFLGMERLDQTPTLDHIVIASGSLALLAGLTVWSKGTLRLFSTLITLVAGYAVCYALNVTTPESLDRVLSAAWIGLPHISPPGMQIDAQLILPFVVLGLSSALKTSGDLTISEKISDADWKRTDIKAGSNAVLCFGVSSLVSGLLGGLALGSSSSNVGLSAATGAVSRYIGFACGTVLILLAFLPKLVALIGAVPAPVVGAMFLLVVSYNLIAGMQIIMTRMMEARHTYIIGMSLLFGLTADAIPGAFQGLPEWLRTLLSSGLTLATVMVVLLNAIFRIGTSKKHTLVLRPATEDVEKIYPFMEECGGQWGARREVEERAQSALVEAYELISGEELAESPIAVDATFDEFSLDVNLRYDGRLPQSENTGILAAAVGIADRSAASLATMLLNRMADRVRMKTSNGRCEIELHFEH